MNLDTFRTLKVGDVVSHPSLPARNEKIAWVEAYYNPETDRRENHSIQTDSGRRMKYFDPGRDHLTLVSKADSEEE